MKLYVQIKEEKDEEGQPLQVVKTYESKPVYFNYIVFLDK